MNEQKSLIVNGHDKQWTLPNGGMCFIPLERPAPGITILVHGVNDVGEAFAYQEQGLCEGLNDRLKRTDIVAANYNLPAPENGKAYTADDILNHPDPDKEYWQRDSSSTTTSPVIPFYWGFREVTTESNTLEKHGQYLDRFGNRLDKRYAKNGGPFANATTNIPDMFGKGFDRNLFVAGADVFFHTASHPLLDAPPRNYMVLAAQRLASLLRIIRKQSQQEPINIVAHSQGCFVTLLAHAILANDKSDARADTIILNNAPYSVDEPGLEKFQTGDEQQTTKAREETLQKIIEYITKKPVTDPKFTDLETLCRGLTGPGWKIDELQRDNRGKVYLYFSPDDETVALPNIQGIGWWGVYEDMRKRLGDRFFQRLFASPTGRNPKAPEIGKTASYPITLKFKPVGANFTWPRDRIITGEVLPKPFIPAFGHNDAILPLSRIDAAIAVTDKESGMRPGETPEDAQARWLGETERNSYHSGIVGKAEHARKATAWDISIGLSGILKNNEHDWIHFLRAVADWRTNWSEKAVAPETNTTPLFPPVPQAILDMLKKIDSDEVSIIKGNHDYYTEDKRKIGGKLPEFTTSCKVEDLTACIVSETVGQRDKEQKKYRRM